MEIKTWLEWKQLQINQKTCLFWGDREKIFKKTQLYQKVYNQKSLFSAFLIKTFITPKIVMAKSSEDEKNNGKLILE